MIEPVFIETKNISIKGSEWLTFNLTSAVRYWVTSSTSDSGILIKCPECATAGVSFQTGGKARVPVLDVKTHLVALKRIKRSRNFHKATKARWRGRRGRKTCHDITSRGKKSSRCCRRSMKVKFNELPRFDFIVAPTEFDAFYCSGQCPARFNPANEHALLQSLLNIRKREEIPRPCCAPKELSSLVIMHYNDDGRLVSTSWNDVIVTECGCS